MNGDDNKYFMVCFFRSVKSKENKLKKEAVHNNVIKNTILPFMFVVVQIRPQRRKIPKMIIQFSSV